MKTHFRSTLLFALWCAIILPGFGAADASAQDTKTTDSALDFVRESGMKAKLQHREFVEVFGANHPSVKQIEKTIAAVEAELKKMGAAPLEFAGEANKKDTETSPVQGDDQRKIIETLVRQSFQLRTKLQMVRVAKAEADLQQIKSQLKERQEAAETIIADRVNQLVKASEMKASETNADDVSDESAALLSLEGWNAWRKRDFRTALKSFQRARVIEPDNDAARNGLGWTYIHLAQYEKAIVEFKKLLKAMPTHPGALNGLGQSLLAQGKLDEAETELLKATQDLISKLGEAETVQRGATASWSGLVRVYLQKKDYAQAKNWCERYLKHKPDDKMMKTMLQQANEKGD